MLSPEELLERCNEIRRAGGAEELEELLPGIQNAPRSCLLARNLNFDCLFIPYHYMLSNDSRLQEVAEALGWEEAEASTYSYIFAYKPSADLSEAGNAFDLGNYPADLYIT